MRFEFASLNLGELHKKKRPAFFECNLSSKATIQSLRSCQSRRRLTIRQLGTTTATALEDGITRVRGIETRWRNRCCPKTYEKLGRAMFLSSIAWVTALKRRRHC